MKNKNSFRSPGMGSSDIVFFPSPLLLFIYLLLKYEMYPKLKQNVKCLLQMAHFLQDLGLCRLISLPSFWLSSFDGPIFSYCLTFSYFFFFFLKEKQTSFPIFSVLWGSALPWFIPLGPVLQLVSPRSRSTWLDSCWSSEKS